MRTFRTLKMPKRAHYLVNFIYKEMNKQRIGITDTAERSGVTYATLCSWRDKAFTPNIANVEAVLGALGYELKIVPKKD